jgi:tRNA threonylcarbamoyladenosine biosynthesis protein TsaB
MNVLALDTSHPTGSVSLRVGDTEPTTMAFGEASSHLVELGDATESLIREAGISIDAIDRVALVSGPGSFTGLRIGLAYAKGLYAALGAKMVTVTSLELLAIEALDSAERVCTLVDARRSEVYGAVYERGEPYAGSGAPYRAVCEVTPRAAAPDAFLLSLEKAPMVCVGSGAERFRPLIEKSLPKGCEIGEPLRPSTHLLSRLGALLPALTAGEILELEPLYIRPSDAKLQPLRKVQTHE